jgi:hypothetical protein
MCRSSLEIRLIVWIQRKMMARLLLEIMLHHVTSLIAGFARAVSPQKSDVSKNRFHLRCKWTFASMDQAGGLDRTHNFTRYAEITADPSLFVTLNTIIEESWVLTQPILDTRLLTGGSEENSFQVNLLCPHQCTSSIIIQLRCELNWGKGTNMDVDHLEGEQSFH